MAIFNAAMDNNSDIVICDPSDNDQEQWLELKTEDGDTVFINKFSGKALGVFAWGTENNERLIQYTYQGLRYQFWRIDEKTGRIANCHSDMFACPYEGGHAHNTGVVQCDDGLGDGQKWEIVPVSPAITGPAQ
jgi:hypothetical protein